MVKKYNNICVETLKPYSRKLVIKVCDNCGNEKIMPMQKVHYSRKTSLKKLGEIKDFCKICAPTMLFSGIKRTKKQTENIAN